MRLNEKEYYQFLALHPKLLYYVGLNNNFLAPDTSLKDFRAFQGVDKLPIREFLYENIGLIDQFIEAYPNEFSSQQIDTLQQFKFFKKGTFYLMEMNEKETLFMDDDYVYAVLAHNDPFILFFVEWPVPIMVETVLLPYKGKIIYDGTISNYPIRFEPAPAKALHNQFVLKKSKHGIIRELPLKG